MLNEVILLNHMPGNPEYTNDPSIIKRNKDSLDVQTPPAGFEEFAEYIEIHPEDVQHISPLKRAKAARAVRPAATFKAPRRVVRRETLAAIAKLDADNRVRKETMQARERIAAQEEGYKTHANQIEDQQRIVREALAKVNPERKIKAMQAAFTSKPSSEALRIDRIPTRSEIREESSLGALQRRAANGFLDGVKIPALQETDETPLKIPDVKPIGEQSFKVDTETYDHIDFSQFKRSEEPKGWLARGWAKVKSWL